MYVSRNGSDPAFSITDDGKVVINSSNGTISIK
jgi:hypothetical protein